MSHHHNGCSELIHQSGRVIFVVTGCVYLLFSVIICISIKSLNEHNAIFEDEEPTLMNLRYVSLALAAVLTGVFTICAGCSFDGCKLKCATVFCFIVLVLAAVNLSLDIVNSEQYGSKAKKYSELMSLYDYEHADTTETKADATKAWDTLQRERQCCGVKNHTEWFEYYDLYTERLPPSCCLKFEAFKNYTQYQRCSADSDSFYKQSCADYLQAAARAFILISTGCLLGWSVVIAIMTLLMLVTSAHA